jgi:hypothetical protein
VRVRAAAGTVAADVVVVAADIADRRWQAAIG